MENIIKIARKYFKNSNVKTRFYSYILQLNGPIDDEANQLRFFFRLFKDDIIQESVIRFFSAILENVEEFFFKSKEIDKDLFNELNYRISESKEKNPEYLMEIVKNYSDSEKNFVKIKRIIKSMLLIKEIIIKKENTDGEVNHKNQNFSIFIFKLNFDEIISFLRDCDEETFEIYLFDFLIKFSFIIESHIKNIMRFLLKLDNLLKNKIYYVEEYKLAKLFRLLNQDPYLKDYRNSIFHSDFIIKFDEDFNNQKIAFKTNEGTINWNIIEIFENFLKIMLLINTFTLAFFYIDFEKEAIIEFVNEFFTIINRESEENLVKEGMEIKEFIDIENKTINQKVFNEYLKKKIMKGVND